MIPVQDEQLFSALPTFDESKFQPPAWAKSPEFQWGDKNGESSTTPSSRDADDVPEMKPFDEEKDQDDGESDGDDVFEDARSTVDPQEAMFSTAELKELLARALGHKDNGNAHYKAKPPRYGDAIASYRLALDHLPHILKDEGTKEDGEVDRIGASSSEDGVKKTPAGTSGIEEVTEDEASAIVEEEKKAKDQSPEEKEREDVEDEIKEATKACWGNLAACYIAVQDDKNVVQSCNEALKFDPHYTKCLHRRATANERLGELTNLTSALEDYNLLKTLLPPSSPLLPSIRRSITTLPQRITVEEKKQYDEMMGKLKDLGNSFLGNFGLSTENFKFEQQPGGGYSMNFSQ